LVAAKSQMQFEQGARLGPYEILAPLGAGGMGEVYRGRDTRLGRAVAIKVISGGMQFDPNRRVRFQREAKAISSLNHPHICALYDVGEHGDLQYIVMEYLEGETLQDRLQNGPLPLTEAVRYGLEIADALESAHRKQILHRDLKPSNIMITASGARLFDFGLAKVLQISEPHSRGSTAAKPITVDGAVLGTPEYIAPEQLRGKEPDVRTDLFSFGVCLFQMITGERPFQGNTYASLVASILEHDPPSLSTYRPEVPSSLEWLIRNCLAKDPDERIQTAHDLKLELTRIDDEMRTPSAPGRVPKPTSRRWVYGVAAAAALIAIAAALIVRQTTQSGAKSSIRRFSIALPRNAPLADGPFERFAVSPDGTRIAYVGAGDTTRLYLYSVDTLEARPLPGTEGARGPFFSPDGQWIAFYTVDQGLKKVALAGGAPILVSPERDLRGATWSADDTIVFAQVAPPMRRVSGSSGHSEAVSLGTLGAVPASVRWPAFLPGGDAILFTATDVTGDYENSKLMISSLKTGRTKTVLNGATYGRYANGHLLYLHSQTLFAAPFDAGAMQVTGAGVPVASDVDFYASSGLAHFAISSDGSLFYIPRDAAASEGQLLWVNRTGESRTPITAAQRAYEQPRLSPDGRRILVTVGPTPRSDLWVYDIQSDTWSRLTNEAQNQSGVWSPDGNQIAFASTKNGGFDLYTMPSDGSAPAQRITARRSWDFPTSWSSDGKSIAVVEQYRATFNDIYIVAPQRDAVPVPYLNTQSDEREPVFSPDGRWMAYRSNESGRDEIYTQSYPNPGRKRLLSSSGGTHPVWRKDGAELFYRNGDKMMAVGIQSRPDFTADKARMLFQGDFEDEYDVTPDGQKFIMVKRPPQSPRTQINVILGFPGRR
jgi:serine/threonine protein kinase/Tol biopolymer transport system component